MDVANRQGEEGTGARCKVQDTPQQETPWSLFLTSFPEVWGSGAEGQPASCVHVRNSAWVYILLEVCELLSLISIEV